MLIPGTQMHIVTFFFVSIEIVIFFYLLIYRLARPDDKTTYLNITLIFLLIIYNVASGLLPDVNMPGTLFMQLSLAYATGFITPCYFPYYVYKAFSLEKMKFHAFKGVYIFLVLPYYLFVIIFAATNNIENAKNLLIVPVLYALWVIISMAKAIKFKYNNDFSGKKSKEEMIVLMLSLTPWVMLPVIDFLNLGQVVEACITNAGFLALFALQMNRHIKEVRTEHERLIVSEKELLNWNSSLQIEVNKRTKDLEIINEQRTNTLVNLAHETKTPLTLINNYLEEYISNNNHSEEIEFVRRSLQKLSTDITNLFDVEKFNRGFGIYDHTQVCNFSEILNDNILLFSAYAKERNIEIKKSVTKDIVIKADPLAINRIIINLLDNSFKFSNNNSIVEVMLVRTMSDFDFIVRDYGVGIPKNLHNKIFEPYYQITSSKNNSKGMGLGLPIVKKVVDELGGNILIVSNPKTNPGTEMIIHLKQYLTIEDNVGAAKKIHLNKRINLNTEIKLEPKNFDANRLTLLVIEDNISMLNYLTKKLNTKYNICAALSGEEALKKMKDLTVLPNLIITDIMMDRIDGYELIDIISKSTLYANIPFIILTAKSSINDKLFGLKLGAIDYLPKPFSINELMLRVDSILLNAEKQKKIMANIPNINKSTIEKTTLKKFEENCDFFALTNREKDIVKLICQGQKYKDIGAALFIAERTVTKHAQNIFDKLNISNKIELINKLGFVQTK